jgi:hypothetical protein
MKDSFEFVIDDWEASLGKCEREMYLGVQDYYVSVLHLKLVIERLIK